MTESRRRSTRYPADWAARFRFDPVGPWRDCRLIDVSWEGAALALDDVAEAEPLAGLLFVDIVELVGDETIHLHGVVRHGARTAMGRTLVGIEFRRLDREELRLLRTLVSVRAAV